VLSTRCAGSSDVGHPAQRMAPRAGHDLDGSVGFYLGIDRNEWCWIVLAIVAVWTAETLNTAVELLADATSPNYHPLIGKAKDVAAGAVLISAIGRGRDRPAGVRTASGEVRRSGFQPLLMKRGFPSFARRYAGHAPISRMVDFASIRGKCKSGILLARRRRLPERGDWRSASTRWVPRFPAARIHRRKTACMINPLE